MSYYSYRPILTDEYYDGKPLDIGRGPQLLASEIIVEDSYRITFADEKAERYLGCPIVEADRPWENCASDPCVLYDEEIGKYRMWYTSSGGGFKGVYTAYAESEDGVHFVKPSLGLVEYNGTKDNNILPIGRDGEVFSIIGRVIFNPDKTDRERRFIMIWGDDRGLSISYSADGINFAMDEEAGIIVSVSMDCRIVFGYDETAKEWFVFTRPTMYAKDESLPPDYPVTANGNYRRTVCVTKSKDLRHFSAPRIVFRSPEHYVATEADNINFFTVGDYPMAFIHMFSAVTKEEAGRQRMCPHLAMGKDVFSLRVRNLEKEVISRGKPGDFDDTRMLIDSPPFDLFGDGRDYFYGRGQDERTIRIAMYSFGHDRYAYAASDEYGGWLLTREFYFDGRHIDINADVPENGEIKVEVLIGDNGQVRGGRAPVGFTIDDCDVIKGDSLAHRLTFHGSDDLSPLVGRAIYLRFHVVNAKLYAFTVKD